MPASYSKTFAGSIQGGDDIDCRAELHGHYAHKVTVGKAGIVHLLLGNGEEDTRPTTYDGQEIEAIVDKVLADTTTALDITIESE